MQTEQTRPTGGRNRAGRKQRDAKYFNTPHLTKSQKIFQGKNHWSRHPEQRRRDAVILAAVGLDFERVGDSTFFHLCRKGV